eukprot:260140_1
MTPSINPTQPPSNAPSLIPTIIPSITPSLSPSLSPTQSPTQPPSSVPSVAPTQSPTLPPSVAPSLQPTITPTKPPSVAPSMIPTNPPSHAPSLSLSTAPTLTPSITPSMTPSVAPTLSPSFPPTVTPSINPTQSPSLVPSLTPTLAPSTHPSASPSSIPTYSPSISPSLSPTRYPTQSDAYKYSLEMIYGFYELTPNNCFYMQNNQTILNNVLLLLEHSYVKTSKAHFNSVSDYLHYRLFHIIVKHKTASCQTTNRRIILSTTIKCSNSSVCSTMRFISSNNVFITDTTILYRTYFTNNNLIFSVSEQHLKQETIPQSTYHLIYGLLSLVVIICFFCMSLLYWRKHYNKAFIVDNALVLIIGISKFDNSNSNLSGVEQNVIDIKHLWRVIYQYDVFVCKENLYCTKRDVIKFIDTHKKKLQSKIYASVIVHIISHGFDDTFLTSDGK